MTPDNTLREELIGVIAGTAMEYRADMQPDMEKTHAILADRILSAVKNRLPKEQKPVDFDNYSGEPRGWFIGHDACLANVKQALDIESEGARE